jgi:hypothetical protein
VKGVAIWAIIVQHRLVTVHLHVTASRGNKLEDVGEISKNLASESKKYNWGAKQLSAMVSAPAPCFLARHRNCCLCSGAVQAMAAADRDSGRGPHRAGAALSAVGRKRSPRGGVGDVITRSSLRLVSRGSVNTVTTVDTGVLCMLVGYA